jgi:pimeloyl-ACP methyl ester carboxylesterase
MPVPSSALLRPLLPLVLVILAGDPASAAARLVGDLPRFGEKPLESLAGVDTEFGVVSAGESRLRTIVTRPSGATGRQPALLFVPWLSCNTVEVSPTAKGGWSVMLRRVVTESTLLVMRVDKSGVGDSVGVPCERLDYETELAQYRAALAALRARPDVDPQRVFVYGASMGSNYAPLVAADQDVAGVIVWGGGAFSWFERMLRFERNAIELGGASPAAVAGEVEARARYFSRYLLDGASPADIASRDPALGAVWSRIVGTSATAHYGRPFAFHQQAQRQNWAGAWARVRAPVLVLSGEFDWFESRDSARLIADVANARAPGSATFVELAGIDHHFTRYPTRAAAFAEKGGVEAADEAVRVILPWLRARLGR